MPIGEYSVSEKTCLFLHEVSTVVMEVFFPVALNESTVQIMSVVVDVFLFPVTNFFAWSGLGTLKVH